MAASYLWGWDETNGVWRKVVVNAEGKLIIDPSEVTLDKLGDVAIPSPANGDFVYYDSASGTWKNIAHKDATTGIHGVGASTIVGTGLSQALTLKTLTSPVISGAGAATQATYGWDATNKTILIGNGTASVPIHVGEWQSFTSTPTNFTTGNGSIVAKYARIGNLVIVSWTITLGSTSAMGTAPYFTTPTSVGTSLGWFGCMIGDTGTATYVGLASPYGASNVQPQIIVVSGSFLTYGAIQPTVPFTWGNTDSLIFMAMYLV